MPAPNAALLNFFGAEVGNGVEVLILGELLVDVVGFMDVELVEVLEVIRLLKVADEEAGLESCV